MAKFEDLRSWNRPRHHSGEDRRTAVCPTGWSRVKPLANRPIKHKTAELYAQALELDLDLLIILGATNLAMLQDNLVNRKSLQQIGEHYGMTAQAVHLRLYGHNHSVYSKLRYHVGHHS